MSSNNFLNQYYHFIESLGGMSFPEDLIPAAMIDEDKASPHDGIKYWKRIPSTITQDEITALEQYYKYPLPTSFHRFLQDQFYLDLEIGELSWRIFDLLPTGRLQFWIEELEMNYQDQVDQHYLVFGEADGLCLCFKPGQAAPDHEYEVGMVDLIEDRYQKIAENFNQFLEQLEVWLLAWQENRKRKG